MSCDKVAINVFFNNTCTFLLTCSNNTQTITIFVSLLFYGETYNGDSQGEH